MTKPKTGTQVGASTLQDRLSTLRRQLNHRDPSALRKAVSMMLLAYRATGRDPDGEANVYCAILADQPADSAIRACLEFPRGKYREAIPTSSATFPPSADELHQAAEIEAGYYHRELKRLETAAGGGSATGRYRPARPGEKTVGEVEAERQAAIDAKDPGKFVSAVEGGAILERLAAELRANPQAKAEKETPAEAERRRRYDEIAAINRGKRPMGRRNKPIPKEHRLELADLPGRDTRTEAQKNADATKWVEAYAAEHGIDLSTIPDQPATFHRPKASP